MPAMGRQKYSGFIVCRLRKELAEWLRAVYIEDQEITFRSLRELADSWRSTHTLGLGRIGSDVQRQAEELHQLLDGLESPTAVDPSRIRSTIALEDKAASGPNPPVRSLIAYFRVDARDLLPGVRAESLVRGLSSFTLLFDSVMREPGLSPPSPRVAWEDDVSPDGGIDASWQFHVEGTTDTGSQILQGINCNSPQVWESGFDGVGVGFVDIELGWDLKHPDLPAPIHTGGAALTPFHNLNNHLFEEHGTGALGIVVGVDNTEGIVGIAPQARFLGVASYASAVDPADITNAILVALDHMQVGDVLLLEIQTTGGGAFPGSDINLPVEIFDLWFDAIRLAVGSRMIVIEPAGNGHDGVGWALDTITSVSGVRTLNRATWSDARNHELDSGAIMVSACYSDLRADGSLTRTDASNYGSRVDCFAWGEEVYTTQPQNSYGSFSGTSAASAIIAGAAILAQQMWKDTFGTPATSGQLRYLLSTVGTSVYAQAGRQPDLGQIAQKIGASPDVFVRDRLGDDGSVPDAFTSQSPDIIVRQVPNAAPTLAGGPIDEQTPPSDPVAADTPNYVYVRMRNRNATDASNVVARVYWAEASTVIVPTDWHFIGQSNPRTVPGAPMNGVPGPLVVTDPPITWTPASGAVPPQMPADHGCFIALLSCAADPAPPGIIANAGPSGAPTQWSDFLEFIGRNNNAAWRNFSLLPVSQMPGASALLAAAEFLVRGASRALRFGFEAVHNLPRGVEVELRVAHGFARLLRRRHGTEAESTEPEVIRMEHEDALPFTGARLPARASYRCGVRLRIDRSIQPQPLQWALRQTYQGQEVGRVTFAVNEESWARARQPDSE